MWLCFRQISSDSVWACLGTGRVKVVRRWYQLLVDGSLVEVDPDSAVSSAAAKASSTTTSAAPPLGQYWNSASFLYIVCHHLIATRSQGYSSNPYSSTLESGSYLHCNRTEALTCSDFILRFATKAVLANCFAIATGGTVHAA